MEIPKKLQPMFLEAGWHPQRYVAPPHGQQVEDDHPSTNILTSLSGLHINAAKEGLYCATSDIDFEWVVDSDMSDVRQWEHLLSTRLVGVAAVLEDLGALYVATDRRCFVEEYISPTFSYRGSFAEAVEGLLLGRRARPMLRPDEDEVTLYGDTFTRASPELYRYDLDR